MPAVIGPGDRLRIATFGEERLTGEFTVTDEGAVAFPLLGEVPAEGRTVSEFTALIQRRLASRYMRNPQVAVQMVNFRPVYILGEVRAGRGWILLGSDSLPSPSRLEAKWLSARKKTQEYYHI